MTDSDQADACYLAALRLLTGRDYTSKRLQEKLQSKGFSPAQQQQAVEKLVRAGYLDDRRYAEGFVASVRESGRYTGFRLKQELRKRGLAADLVDEILQQDDGQHDQLAKAMELVKRRYSDFNPGTADERYRRRVAGFLQRRGYGFEIVRTVLSRTDGLVKYEYD